MTLVERLVAAGMSQDCAALMVVALATVDASEILWAGIPARGVEVVVGTAAMTPKKP